MGKGRDEADPALRGSLRLRRASWRSPPDGQYDHRAHDGPDEARPFARPVPAQRLAKPGGHEGAHDAQNGGQDEARRLIGARHQELGDNARNETDNDRP